MKPRQVPFFLYWRVENVLFWINSIGHLGWLSCILNFPRFHKNVNSLELWKYISENSSPKGSFWRNKRKSEFSLLSADSRYLLAVALNKTFSPLGRSAWRGIRTSVWMGYWPSLFGQDGWIFGKFFFTCLWGNFSLGTRRVVPSGQGSQSQRAIWFILPAHGDSFIIKEAIAYCEHSNCVGHFMDNANAANNTIIIFHMFIWTQQIVESPKISWTVVWGTVWFMLASLAQAI